MEKLKREIFLLSIAIVLISLVLGYLWYNKLQSNGPTKVLPIFGIEDIKEKNLDGKIVYDTVFHQVPDFSFTNQDGKQVSQQNLQDVVYVADFFFTTCPSICKDMAKQKIRLYKAFENNPQVKIVSHTVNPENDSVPVMKAYAKRCKITNTDKWYLLTGDKKALYSIARDGYHVNATKGDGGPDDFIHTENFALVDKNKRIRGYYNGTSEAEVNQLMYDIEQLLLEEKKEIIQDKNH